MENIDYGVIGNCRSAALVSREGSIDWCCLPEFDSPSAFAKILDREKGGHFAILVKPGTIISQEFIRYTNILKTTFQNDEGIFEVIDFMPRYKTSDDEYFIPGEIYRYIRPISGKPSFVVDYEPRLNYARDQVAHVIQNNYIRTYSASNPSDCLYLYSDIPHEDILKRMVISLDEPRFMLLTYNQKLINIDLPRVYLEYQRTKVYWLNWANRCKKYELYTDEIVRSLLTLKIMSYQRTGAMLAALTTSIPETLGEVRNWDYRFCWIRDASMSIDTLFRMGHYDSVKRFLTYIKGILKSKNDSFQIMYGIRGERDLTESELEHLEGYAGSRPVRIGNSAYVQRQNDVFGYLLNVIYHYYAYFPGTLDEIEEMWEIVRNIVRTVVGSWNKPDQGIWELRNSESHFVFSKVMCWVAMDRAVKISRMLHRDYYALAWQKVSDEIRRDVFQNGWSEALNSFTQAYGVEHLDASLLLMEEYGFIEASDPKFRSTVYAVKDALFRNNLMYRYKNNDDFGLPTSSFTICTFWLVRGMFVIGETEEAQRIFNNLLSYSNYLGLFSEDIDFESKRLLGNFPQAYSHLALINTACLFSSEKAVSKFIKP